MKIGSWVKVTSSPYLSIKAGMVGEITGEKFPNSATYHQYKVLFRKKGTWTFWPQELEETDEPRRKH